MCAKCHGANHPCLPSKCENESSFTSFQTPFKPLLVANSHLEPEGIYGKCSLVELSGNNTKSSHHRDPVRADCTHTCTGRHTWRCGRAYAVCVCMCTCLFTSDIGPSDFFLFSYESLQLFDSSFIVVLRNIGTTECNILLEKPDRSVITLMHLHYILKNILTTNPSTNYY